MTKASGVSSLSVVRQLWEYSGLPVQVLDNTLRQGGLELGHDPALHGQAVRSSFQITAVAQGCTAAIALAAQLCTALVQCEDERRAGSHEKLEEKLRTLVLGPVSVDARHAVAEYKGWTRIYHARERGKNTDIRQMLRESIASDSEAAKELLGIDAHAVADWDSLAGLYRTAPSGRDVPDMVRIHTNFPHHKLGILQLLGLVPESMCWNDVGIHDVFAQFKPPDLQHRLDTWDAFEFEACAQQRGLCVTAYRTSSEWQQSEMGRALAGWMRENGGSPFRISRLTSTTTGAMQRAEVERRRMRVVDMSRVIAGPISSRALAAHGADVILVSGKDLPNLPLRELETARAKRSALVDLPRGGKELPAAMRKLVEEADVVSQAYRPGGLAERGLGPEQVQALRPGIVYAELCAFGFAGPWAHMRAYDSLTQTACGMNHLEALSYRDFTGAAEAKVEPKPMPIQALDYAAGSLLCLATLAAKCRGLMERLEANTQREEKGWHVQVSLASTAEWIQSLGQLHGDDAWAAPPAEAIPNDPERLAAMTSSYRVRGLSDEVEGDVFVLAIRHPSIAPQDLGTEDDHEQQRWSVPAYLGVDSLEW